MPRYSPDKPSSDRPTVLIKLRMGEKLGASFVPNVDSCTQILLDTLFAAGKWRSASKVPSFLSASILGNVSPTSDLES